MSAELPLARPEPSMTEVVVGGPARGRLAREMAHILHWCRGHGMQVVPCHYPYLQVSGSVTLRYRVEPQGHALTRFWVILIWQQEALTGGTTPVTVDVLTPDSQVTPITGITVSGIAPGYHTIIREDLTSKSDAEQELAVTFSIRSGTAVPVVHSVACYELPRAILTQDTYDRGVDIETCQAGQPIYDSLGKSLGAITRNLAYTWPRRSLVQQSGEWLSYTSGTFGDLTTLPMPCLPHRKLRADTTLTCKWGAYVKTAAASTGEVRITTGIDGTTQTLTIATDTSGGWVTGEIAIRCEDPTTADGRPSGGWETVQLALRITSGTSVSISSWSVWEPDQTQSFLLQEDGSYLLQEDGSRIELED